MADENKNDDINKTIQVSLETWRKLNKIKIDNNFGDLDAAVTLLLKAKK